MKISNIRFSLLFVFVCFMVSCTPNQEFPSVDEGFVDEAVLEPVDFSFEEVESEGQIQLMGDRDPECKFLGRIRKVRAGDDCQFLIELRGNRFLSPINVQEIYEKLKPGRFVYVGVERSAEGPCDKGIPAFITCISGLEIDRKIDKYSDIQITDGN